MIILQRTDARSPQLHHRMTDHIEHASNLLIATLMENHLEPGIGSGLVNFCDLGRSCLSAIVEYHAASDPLDRGFRRQALHFRFVNLFHAIARSGDEVGEIAIIRQQQETFSIEIQAADGMKAAQRWRQKFGYRGRPDSNVCLRIRLSVDENFP